MVLATEQILNKLKENYKNAQSTYENTNNLAKVGMIEETDAKNFLLWYRLLVMR